MNKKELAKQRSFICKLTKDQIVTLLKQCGFVLNTEIYSEDDGQKLPAIEKGYNKETDEFELFIRCKIIDPHLKEVIDMAESHFPLLSLRNYSILDSMVVIKDFELFELSICEDKERSENLQNIFVNFMYETFGEDYRTKYNNYIKKLIEEDIEKQKDNC